MKLERRTEMGSIALKVYQGLTDEVDEKEKARLIADAFQELEQRYPEVKDLATGAQLTEKALLLQKEIRELEVSAAQERKRIEVEAQQERQRIEAEAQQERLRIEAEAQQERQRIEADAQQERQRIEADAQQERQRIEADAQQERQRLAAELQRDLKVIDERIAKTEVLIAQIEAGIRKDMITQTLTLIVVLPVVMGLLATFMQSVGH